LANTRFQTVYNYIGLGLKFEIREMEFGEMKRNTSNWSNFCMLLRRAGLTASAGLSCYGTLTRTRNLCNLLRNVTLLKTRS